MVTHAESKWMDGIKPPDLGAGGNERLEEIVRQQPRADSVDEYLHAHSAPGGSQQGLQKPPPQLAIGIDVSFELDGFFGGGNGLQEVGENLDARAMPADVNRSRHGGIQP